MFRLICSLIIMNLSLFLSSSVIFAATYDCNRSMEIAKIKFYIRRGL